jgi:hypothetical protein
MTRPRGVDILERLVIVEQKATAAHARMDKTDEANARAWAETKAELQGISKDLKDVIAWMNRGKGWAAAGLVMAGVLGGLAGKFLGGWKA